MTDHEWIEYLSGQVCVFQTMLGTDFRGSWAVISREAGQ